MFKVGKIYIYEHDCTDLVLSFDDKQYVVLVVDELGITIEKINYTNKIHIEIEIDL